MYKISLDEEISNSLRDSINENQDISIKYSDKNKNGWNTICSILDRIDYLVIYLNSLELNTGKYKYCAFDFFEFINASGVLIECIDKLAKIYNIDTIENNTNIFKNKIINEKVKQNYIQNGTLDKNENDYQYFKYLRSLSSVHPVDTNRHLIYMADDVEVSPYAVWSDGIFYDKAKGDLIIVAYSQMEEFKHVFVSIEEIFEFVKYKYNHINVIIDKIKKHSNQVIENLKKRKIKTPDSFENYNEYLNNLIKECDERCPNLVSDIREAKELINIYITNKNNEKKYKKFCNAIKYAISIIHKCLQNMDFTFLSDKEKLLFELINPSKTYTEESYHYQLEKINYLKGDYGDPVFGRDMFKILLPLFKKYITITDEDFIFNLFDYELYVLSRVALYFNNLNNDSIVNKVVPNNQKYRFKN